MGHDADCTTPSKFLILKRWLKLTKDCVYYVKLQVSYNYEFSSYEVIQTTYNLTCHSELPFNNGECSVTRGGDAGKVVLMMLKN